MIRIITIITTMLFVFSIGEGLPSTEGLYFRSNYDTDNSARNLGTTLKIPEKGMIKFRNTINLEFDIFFWRKDPFGFILSGGNDKNPDLLVLSYSDYKNLDTSYIELTYNNRPSIISIPIVDKDQGWKKWKNIKLYLESERQRVGLSFNFEPIIWHSVDKAITERINFRFGTTSRSIEPPRMAIRNIIMNRDNEETKVWKLNENSGDVAHQKNKNDKSWNGIVTDGIWMKELHSSWRKTGSYSIISDRLTIIGLNRLENEFIFSSDDSLYYIDLMANEIVKVHPFSYVIDKNYNYFYNQITDEICATHGGGGGPIIRFDSESNNWQGYNSDFESDDLYYQSQLLFDLHGGDIFAIGGYGWYEQKNILQKYNTNTRSWDAIKYKIIGSHNFFPRSRLHVNFDPQGGKYLIYGGGGNESGKQQQGFRQLNDLWSFDLETMTLKNIWEDESEHINKKTIYDNYLILPKMDRVFNIQGLDSDMGNLKITLRQSLMSSKNFTDTRIGFNLDESNTSSIIYSDLLYDSDKLIIGVLNKKRNRKKKLDFYTISLPLLMPNIEEKNFAGIILFVFLFIGIAGLLFSKPKKVNNNQQVSIIDKIDTQNQIFKKPILKRGVTVHFLGGFRLWIDEKEIQISKWGSKKARELFIYILLKNGRGASLVDINAIFWPDVKLSSARNSRSVALSRIRDTIYPYGKMIKKIDDRIAIIDNPHLFSDYRELLIKLNNIDYKETKLYPLDPLQAYGKNGLLPDLSQEWLDFHRIDLSESIYKYAAMISEKFIDEKNWEDLEWVGSRLLRLNQFNDNGLAFSVLANKKMSKDGLAHQIYDDFIKKYEMEMGEKYPTSYDNLISS